MSIREIEFWLEQRFNQAKNDENAYFMSKYMKNNFSFYGIKTPERRAILKELITTYSDQIKLHLIPLCFAFFEKDEREWHQMGIDLLLRFKSQISKDDAIHLQHLILSKSWWDSVDIISTNLIGPLFKTHPELVKDFIPKWRNHSSFWINRTCIIFQLKYKEAVDTELLRDLIVQFHTSKEFFIQKAIGWMLREYTRTNPEWVISITQEIDLKPLSKREALRLLK